MKHEGNMVISEFFLLFFIILSELNHARALTITSNSNLETYIKLCGSDKLCGEYSIATNNFTQSQMNCNECDCDEKCYMKGTCCPDLHLNTCVSISLLSMSPFENSTTFVYMLSDCPSVSNDVMCKSSPVAPVTSIASNVTYRNIHCAVCNGEEDVEPWGLVIEGCTREHFDINIYSNLSSIYTGVAEFGCNFGFDWTMTNADVTACRKKNIDSCNVTGLWDKYDREIELACETNDNPYTFFSNIFCFICNTGIPTKEPLIDTCPVGSDQLVSELCKSEKEEPRWFPYKNAFCKSCSSTGSSKLLQQYYNVNLTSPYPYEITISIGNESYLLCEFQYSSYYRFIGLSKIFESICNKENKKTSSVDERSLRSDFENTFNEFRKIQNDSRINIDLVSLYETYKKFGGSFDWCFSNMSQESLCQDNCFIGQRCYPDKMADTPYQCKKYKGEKLKILARCPTSYPDEIVRYYCEREEIGSGTIIDVIPIASFDSEIEISMQYKNIFCFICNSPLNETITELQNWYSRKITFRCPEYVSIDNSVMVGKTYLYLENVCEVEFKTERKEVEFDCGSISVYPSTISFCPRIDRDYPHKDEIIYLCENASMLLFIEYCSQYVNFFCEICNFMKHCHSNECGREMQMNKIRSSFLACDFFTPRKIIVKQQCEVCIDYRHLFSLFQTPMRGEFSANIKDCKTTEIHDPRTGYCRNIACHEGREYIGGCKSLLSGSQNLLYELNVKMSINSTVLKEYLSTDTMLKVLHVLTERIEGELEDLPHIHVYHMSCKEIKRQPYDEEIKLSFKSRVKTTGVVSRDETEEQLLKVQEDLEQFQTDTLIKKSIMIQSQTSTLPFENLDLEKMCSEFVPKNSAIKGHVFHVNKFLSCEQFILDEKEYLIENGQLFLTVNLDEKKQIGFMRDSTNQVRVCISDYLPLFSINRLVSWLTFWEILPTVCVSTSTLCLGITIAIYCALKQYRNLPGKNILSLIISQMLAQTILLLKSIPVGDTYCMVIGCITHYTWLTMFFATANCTINIYLAFNVNFAARNEKKTFLISLFIIIVGPMVIVGSYLLYIFQKSISYPYRTTICFMTDFFSLMVFFHVPVSIICLTNLTFFVLISYHLHTLTYIRSNQDKRNNYIICLKLFLLTGLSWILQLVDSLLPFSSFTYIVSVINGCQGIFILLVLLLSKNIRVAMVTSMSRTDST